MTQKKVARGGRLIASVEALFAGLPSPDERRDLAAAVDQLIRFLEELKASVDRLPADPAAVREALSKVAALLDTAERNSTLGSLVGVARPRGRTAKPTSALSRIEAEARLAELGEMPEEEVRARLNTSPLPALRGMAQALGIPDARGSRESLANKIASKVVNAQGYRLLRGADTS